MTILNADDARKQRDGQTLRQPPLRLTGVPGAERYADLTDDHRTYRHAAFAWRYAAQLDERGRLALFSVLVGEWPRRQGRRRLPGDDRAVATAARLGVPTEVIAEAWALQPDSVERKIKAGAAMLDAEAAAPPPRESEALFTPAVEIVTGDDAEELLVDCSIEPTPRDPADDAQPVAPRAETINDLTESVNRLDTALQATSGGAVRVAVVAELPWCKQAAN